MGVKMSFGRAAAKTVKITKLSNKSILKYGATATAAAGLGAYAGGLYAGVPGQRQADAETISKHIVGAGLVATAVGLARKPIGAFVAGAAKGGYKGLYKYVYRRVRGRIVPIRVKV